MTSAPERLIQPVGGGPLHVHADMGVAASCHGGAMAQPLAHDLGVDADSVELKNGL